MSEHQQNNDLSDAKTNPSCEPSVESADKRSWGVRHKLLTFAITFLLAAAFHYLVTRPVDNPQPQKKLLVQGSFPYDKGLELRIDATYYSESVSCRQTARAFFIFPQAEVAHEAWRNVPVVREGGNRYRFEFYPDAVLPGFCDWRLQFVFYRIYKDGKNVQGGAILGFPGRFNVIRYGCSNLTSTYFRSPDRTPIIETGVTCYEGDSHWKDSAKTDHQIDFVWEEKQK
jgi:hypothetical protein